MASRRVVTVVILFGAAWLWGSVLHARPRFAADGPCVSVETERYRVVMDGLAITQVVNRLTGEVYASRPQSAAPPTVALRQMLADQGVSVESLRPAVPVKRFGIGPQTRITSRAGFGSAMVTYTGLQYGTGEKAEFEKPMTITLTLTVDSRTGDLIITPTVKGNIELVHGVRDRGVLRNSLHVLGLASDLKVILPVSEGQAFTAADAGWMTNALQRWAWPQHWEAALAIAESDRGCLGIWADEAPLRYGRHLSLCRGMNDWNLGFEFETSDAIYRCDEIKDASWRLNVYRGYWANAASPYVEQMKRQWGMRPLTERSPAWAGKARIVLGSSIPEVESARQLAKLVPDDALLSFTSQGWLKGWNTGEMKFKDWFPNWPWDNPVRYEGLDVLTNQFRALEALHVHVFPYTNPTIVDGEHPWLKNKLKGRSYFAWQFWQRAYPELCQDVVARYGVSAIYEDCSWVVARHDAGEPDGDNWCNGSVHMREYFHQLLPEVALMGERNNEVTARGQHFALGWITDASATRHPICGYLFNPFIAMWNLGQNAKSYDDDDIRGFPLTKWPEWFNANPLQEDLMVRKRGLVFAREQLVSAWPETWAPAVLHYWRGKDGTEYRFVRDRGTRFVKVRADGGLDTIYWRLHGVTNAIAPGVGIDGWLAYDGDRILGLNPHVPQYVTVAGVERPPVTISAVPEGFTVSRSVVRDGFWLASLEAIDRLQTAPLPEAPLAPIERAVQTLRVRSAQPVRFVGVESAKSVDGGYEVQVALPGGFGAYWSEPSAATTNLEVGALSAAYSVHDRQSGVVYDRGDAHARREEVRPPVGAPPAQEGTVAWLLTLPAQPVRLAFTYGTEHGYGDGANYMVRVNSRDVWKAYRPQIASNPEEAKAHKAPPIPAATVDLSAYAGQTVILELAANGHHSGGSETIAWRAIHLEPLP